MTFRAWKTIYWNYWVISAVYFLLGDKLANRYYAWRRKRRSASIEL